MQPVARVHRLLGMQNGDGKCVRGLIRASDSSPSRSCVRYAILRDSYVHIAIPFASQTGDHPLRPGCILDPATQFPMTHSLHFPSMNVDGAIGASLKSFLPLLVYLAPRPPDAAQHPGGGHPEGRPSRRWRHEMHAPLRMDRPLSRAPQAHEDRHFADIPATRCPARGWKPLGADLWPNNAHYHLDHPGTGRWNGASVRASLAFAAAGPTALSTTVLGVARTTSPTRTAALGLG